LGRQDSNLCISESEFGQTLSPGRQDSNIRISIEVCRCRLDRELAEIYVAWRRTTCSDAAVANDLHQLRRALGYLCPSSD